MRPRPQENERQEAGKCSEPAEQTQAPLEKNGQLQDGRLTQSFSELNLTDRSRNQNQQPQNNVSENIKQQEGSSNKDGGAQNPQQTEIQNTGVTTNLKIESENQDTNTENSQGQSVHSKPTNNSSSDSQPSLANQNKGDYKSNSGYSGATNQRDNYQGFQNTDFNNRGSRDGTKTSQVHPHRQNYNRYNNEQMPYRPPYGQALNGTTYFNFPPFDRQVGG